MHWTSRMLDSTPGRLRLTVQARGVDQHPGSKRSVGEKGEHENGQKVSIPSISRREGGGAWGGEEQHILTRYLVSHLKLGLGRKRQRYGLFRSVQIYRPELQHEGWKTGPRTCDRARVDCLAHASSTPIGKTYPSSTVPGTKFLNQNQAVGPARVNTGEMDRN